MSALNKEQKLIAEIKSMVGAGGRFIGDDCAVLPDKLLVTTDTLVEQTHFNLDWTDLNELGWKAMAVNLSDIAAMAGIPKYALIVLSAPEKLYESRKIISLYEGLNNCAQHYKTLIVGGDITRSPHLVVTVTIIGQANDAGVLLRSGAKAGDAVLVTGDFGASHVALRLLQNSSAQNPAIKGSQSHKSPYNHCLESFLTPKPKLAQAWQLVERIGSRGALMDTSDGLADALLQISQASKVGMEIDLKEIPIHEQTIKYAREIKADPLEFALYGGEDYQLLACLSMQEWSAWQKGCPDIQNYFKQIGIVNDTSDIQLKSGNEKAYKLDPNRIFQHIS